jgi:FMN-dependent NADH-azoreductase
MSLFRLDASIRGAASRTSALADLVEQEWRAATGEDSVVRRHIGEHPLPPAAWSASVAAHWSPEDQWNPEQRAAAELAASLVDELAAADGVIIAAPLYNYGVSQHLKTWVDLVITDARMRAGILAGKPTVLLTARGGSYGPGMPRAGWDHATGWMRHIFGEFWQLDLTVVEEELVYVGINPAFDKYQEDAVRVRAEAVTRAEAAGRSLAAVEVTA